MLRGSVKLLQAFLPCLTPPTYASHAYNAELSLVEGAWTLDKLDLLPEGVQPQITIDELIACEDTVRNDPTVQKLAKEVGALEN